MGTTWDGPIIARKGFQAPQALEFLDDFIGGYTTLAAPWPAAATVGANWGQLITGAAPPTVTAVADSPGGRAALALTATSEAQQAGLAHINQRNFLVTNGGEFIARVIIPTLPTLLAKFFIGLASDNAANPDSITHSIWFEFDANGLRVAADDNSVDTNIAVAGLTVAANDVFLLRCNFDQIGNIRFYVIKNPTPGTRLSWSRVAQGTVVPFGATGANATLQPFLSAAKASGAGVGTLQVDSFYARVNR